MKTIVLFIAALFLLSAGAAHAGYYVKVKAPLVPPQKYDHLYPGRVKIIREDAGSLPCRPQSMAIRLGCAYLEEPDKDANLHLLERDHKECVIYLAAREDIEDAGYTEHALLRHEMAGCNGWKGYRSLGSNMIWTDINK